ncbi:MAG: penicillin-binding protein 2 [Candidatus Omnitrophica bacterium]|nr:penicillin-binding protein 2 [Candidatus Omnitrophota bacterium]
MRAARLSFLLWLGFVVVASGLFRMQVLKGDAYRALSEKNRIRVAFLEAPRGRIVDRRGRALAENRLSFNCTATPAQARFNRAESCRILGAILEEDPGELQTKLEKGVRRRWGAVVLAEDVPASQAMAIEERLDLLPGFAVETRPQREYPYAQKAAHLVGFVGPIDREELEQSDFYDYRADDWLGRDGVEKAYENYLRGRSGGIQTEVDSRGRIIKVLGLKEPKEGREIQLTVDAELQVFIQDLFGPRRGAAIVMELEEGGILAMNSSPSFDPNLFASHKGRSVVGKYLVDSAAPMVNRGIRGQYPPGSIFKVITALSALGGGRVSKDTSFLCQGSLWIGNHRFRCWRENGHGAQEMADGFAHSCNVYFYELGLRAGMEALSRKALEWGFSRLTGIDVPGEKKGFVPSKEWKRRLHGASWYEGETANFSIGQGYLQVTPLQVLSMTAAVAAGGEALKPHLMDKINGIKAAGRSAREIPVRKEDLRAVVEGLDRVVNSETGTGRLARLAGVRVCGKTGTAQAGQNESHAWFAGFAPLEKPKIALVVFLEHGGRGGVAAASFAASIWKRLKETGYL